MAKTPHALRPDGYITPAFSIYLDFIRAAAALLVLVFHLRKGGIFQTPYEISTWGHEAVILFFILSGVVIAESGFRPGLTLRGFAINRAARIYAVAIPAILLSYAFAWGLDIPSRQNEPLAILSSLLFLNESWDNSLEVPLNGPYWSLCFEIWYYVLFAAFFFLKGGARWLALAVAAAIMGPRLLVLLPVWLIGIWIAKDQRFRNLSKATGVGLAVLGLALFMAPKYLELGHGFRVWMEGYVPNWGWLRHAWVFPVDALMGFGFALHVAGVRALSEQLSGILLKLAKPIRLLSGSSFAIYLFHRPMISALRLNGITAEGDPALILLIFAAIIAVCMALGTLSEKQAPKLKALLERAWPDRRVQATT